MRADDLRGLFLFEGLSDDQLHDLVAAGDEVPLRRRNELFHEGAPPTSGGCCSTVASIWCARRGARSPSS